jgi:hypothetical protein
MANPGQQTREWSIAELYRLAVARRRAALTTPDPEVAALASLEATRLTVMADNRKARLEELKQTRGKNGVSPLRAIPEDHAARLMRATMAAMALPKREAKS